MDGCALVTGAAGDLGRAIALALAADGWSLVLADHPSQAARLDQARAACGSSAQVATATFDVTDERSVHGAFDALGGAPAAVVANAGVQGDFAPIQDHDSDALRRVLDVNVAGVFATIKVAARSMIDSGTRGSIVAMASMAGVNGAPNMPAYAASKAAVIGLVKSASRDLAPHGIRVNAVSPGFIGPGAMWDNQVARQAAAGSQYFASEPAAVAEQMLAAVPLRRYGSPAEVADVVAYLAGDRSSYVTGANIEVAGGAL